MSNEQRRRIPGKTISFAALLWAALGNAGCGSNQGGVSPPSQRARGWAMTTELVGLDLTTVWGDGSDIFTAGNGAIVAHSGDEGMTWVQVDTSAAAGAATPVYHHIAGSGGGDVWIAGSV